jgi:lipoyl(octanoyl) transferase
MKARKLHLKVLDELTSYDEAHDLQLRTVAKIQSGEAPDTLIMLEHAPVITLGRNADASGVIASENELLDLGIRVRRAERGGLATYHGPGQVVGYPIVDLKRLKMGIRNYVSGLEEVMIRAAADLGVNAARKKDVIGVFCDQGKLGAIGVRVSRGVAFHGFAFNVSPDLSCYRLIAPCGMINTPVTSIAAVTGSAPTMDRVRQSLIAAFEAVFGFRAQVGL